MKLKRKGEEREVNGGVRLISLFNFDFWLQEGGRREGEGGWVTHGHGPCGVWSNRQISNETVGNFQGHATPRPSVVIHNQLIVN